VWCEYSLLGVCARSFCFIFFFFGGGGAIILMEKNGGLNWIILVGEEKHNVQKPM